MSALAFDSVEVVSDGAKGAPRSVSKSAKAKTTTIPIADLTRDPVVNSRAAGVSEKLAAEYAEALKGGAKFPPPVVFRDEEVSLLADGYHRVRAHELAGLKEVAVDLRDGDRRAAILYAAGANATHGARRSRADVRRAVLALLADPEWAAWSDREIAAKCAVSPTTVGTLRKQLSKLDSSETRRGKDGKGRRAPKRKARPTANPARALKDAKRGLDAVARRWPNDRAALVAVVRAWLEGFTPAEKEADHG